MKKIPLGIDDFEEIISGNYYYVDKTLFIKKLIDTGTKVTLLPRPRRFGKTLNMSMLQTFFEKEDISEAALKANKSNRNLFDGLAVSQYPKIMKHQGRYPVIFMSLKSVKHNTWSNCYEELKGLISKEFEATPIYP